MNEKDIIKGKPINIFPIVLAIILLAVLCFVFIALPKIQSAYEYYGSSLSSVMFSSASEVGISITIVLAICLFALFVYVWLGKIEITVSDKRVYGKAAFGKRVDLPLDSISAVATSALNGISVASSSGKISFLMIKNSAEVHKCVSDLLVERQGKQTETTIIKQELPQSNADELKKYKELLDQGVLTQEEFDAKKKQLLGL